MSYPQTPEPDEKYPEDIEPTEDEEETEYTAEEAKQALDTDSAVEREQLETN